MSKSIVGLLCAGSVLIAVLLTGCSFLQSSHRQSPEAETVIPVLLSLRSARGDVKTAPILRNYLNA